MRSLTLRLPKPPSRPTRLFLPLVVFLPLTEQNLCPVQQG